MESKLKIISIAVPNVLYVLYIIMFILRLIGKPQLGHLIASLQFISVIPLLYLLLKAPQSKRPVIYYIQIGLWLIFLIIELLLDYLLKIEFRQTRWMVITYVTAFFAAAGGLLGIAASAQIRLWSIISIALFLIMAVLAFISRAVTGI